MTLRSKPTVVASIFACLLSGMMISSASANQNSVGWKTSNPGRNDVFDIYDATRTAPPETSGTVDWNTENAGRNEVFDAYDATRTSPPKSAGTVNINTTNAHRNDVYDIYKK
jgi:hypothetical protein